MINKVLIIAEAGVNHNGDFEMAKKLIDVAAEAGADIVKFQTFKAEKIVTRDAIKAEYQVRNSTDGDNTQFNMLKKLEMPDEWHLLLKNHSASRDISFLSTPFDEDSIDFLDKLGIPFFKVPSGEITNLPYLLKIASKKKPVILSTGMADMSEIIDAINLIESRGIRREQITVLHCNTEYPTPMTDVNLLAMHQIKSELGVKFGYSDHTLGIEVPIAAVALGATVIEKHFTLDRSLPGPDHLASIEPDELKKMVNSIRNIELAISGSGKKQISVSEEKNKTVARKSICYNKSLRKGYVISETDLIALRPGNGMSPMKIPMIVGKTLDKDVTQNAMVSLTDFKA